MNRKSFLLMALLSGAVITAGAQGAGESEKKYELKVGQLTMTIDAAHGGKILSLKQGDQEVISQSRWPESFGSTFWTSPQKEWNWPPVPEFDKAAYTVEQEGENHLVLSSPVSEKLHLRVGKEFAVDASDQAFVVTYSITNEGSEPRQVAPWEITRVPNAGTIFFDAPAEAITPAGVLDFKAAHGAMWYDADEAAQNRKINADARGWLAYCNNGLLLMKQFQDLSASMPAPGEAEVQVYVNRGKSYIELESQGAYTLLAPGQRLSWTVRWYLMPVAQEPLPSRSLLQRVRHLSNRAELKADSLKLQRWVKGQDRQVNMPLFQTKYTADPSPIVVGDTLFLFTSHDAHPEDIPDVNERSSAGFFMYDWLLWSTTDMVNWTEHGAVASLKDFSWRSRDNGGWAIQTVERNGHYYLYAPLHGHGIGVLVSDSPYGPFKDPLGKPLVWQKENWDDIDPTVFVDDDGQAYMYWGNPNTYYCLLNDDMISLKSAIVKLDYKIEHYQEGPWFYKRNGHYYLGYASTCCPEALGYAMSDKPTGPWKSAGYIMRPTQRDRGNHPGIVDYKGHSYVFGQNYDLMHIDTFEHHEQRSVSATEIHYLPDGTIGEVPYWLDQKPMEQLHWLNPYQRVEAETMAWGKGLKSAKMGIPNTGVVNDMPYSTGRRNMYVTDIDDGEYIRLRGVDFGSAGAKNFSIAALATGACTITLHLDEISGPVIGVVNIKGNDSAKAYRNFTSKVKGASGVHDLYLCFSNASGNVCLDWWQFK